MIQIIKNKLDNHVLVYWDKLLKKSNVEGDGFIETPFKKIRKDGDYILGWFSSTGSKGIKPDGNFKAFRPTGEQQNDLFEKMWCVGESACNNIETIFNYFIWLVNNNKANTLQKELVRIFKHFGLIIATKCLLSTSYVAVGAGTTRRGNSQKKAGNFIRHKGLVPKGSWPNYETWNQLYYPKGGTWINGNRVPQKLLDIGKEVAEYVDISYEWVSVKNFEKTYKKGVMQTSCHAPSPIRGGIIQDSGKPRNHAIQTDHKGADFYGCFGSYTPFDKRYALNYPLGWGMLYSFKLKKPFKSKWELEMEKGRKFFIRADARGECYKITPTGLIHLKTKAEIKEAISKETDLNADLLELTEQKKVIWVTEDYYNKFK